MNTGQDCCTHIMGLFKPYNTILSNIMNVLSLS